MQYLSDFFSFVHQCCDADMYLDIGKACAETGECYDRSRPLGSVYWFSIPYRLGWPTSATLIAGHLLLTLLSIALSVVALFRLTTNYFVPLKNRKTLCLFIFGSLMAHAVYLYPVFRIAYSDAPASLFALIAFWLLLIVPSKKPARYFMWIAIGLGLGISAWIRSFFLYPVLGVLAFWFLFWLLKKNRDLAQLGLLVALLPIASQLHTTWQHTGAIAYIDPYVANRWTYTHLTDKEIGFDTTQPARTRWYSSCTEYTGLLPALQTRDLHSLYCLVSGKLNFYLGSYSGTVYRDLGVAEYIYGPNLLDATGGLLLNMKRERAVAPGVDASSAADRLSKLNTGSYAEIFQTVELANNSNPYSFSTWVWGSTEPCLIDMAVRNSTSRQIIASKQFSLTPEQGVKSIEALVTQSGLYDVVVAAHASCHTAIYLWEAFDLRLVTHSEVYTNPDNIRWWSKGLLTVNLLALLAAVFFLFQLRKNLQLTQWLAPLFMLLVFTEGLVIIPEQRFAMAPIIAIWALCLMWVSTAKINR